MHLIFRPARLSDLPALLPCARDRHAFDDAGREQLLHLWRALLYGGAMNSVVFEDIQSPRGNGIAFFAFQAFATPKFAAALRSDLPPCVAVQALEWWRVAAPPF